MIKSISPTLSFLDSIFLLDFCLVGDCLTVGFVSISGRGGGDGNCFSTIFMLWLKTLFIWYVLKSLLILYNSMSVIEIIDLQRFDGFIHNFLHIYYVYKY